MDQSAAPSSQDSTVSSGHCSSHRAVLASYTCRGASRGFGDRERAGDLRVWQLVDDPQLDGVPDGLRIPVEDPAILQGELFMAHFVVVAVKVLHAGLESLRLWQH